MTIKEAIVKVLEENKDSFTYLEVYDLINKKKYINWGGKTPKDTIGALLGNFIRDNDNRVKRIKGKNGFEYYLSKYENELNLKKTTENNSKTEGHTTYKERDLHLLLSSYLNYENIYSKTIFHEKSTNTKDNHQKWIHPDMVGCKFTTLKNHSSNTLMKSVNKNNAFELSSYEIKKEINSDYELKQYFFQTVSNSSWANYAYLVAFEIADDLKEEIERLNQSFGIGVIKLQANPFESKVLYHAKHKELDFKTIDKLCEINKDFEKFINQTETLLTAEKKYADAIKKDFIRLCDIYLQTDTEIKNYCIEKHIPLKEE